MEVKRTTTPSTHPGVRAWSSIRRRPDAPVIRLTGTLHGRRLELEFEGPLLQSISRDGPSAKCDELRTQLDGRELWLGAPYSVATQDGNNAPLTVDGQSVVPSAHREPQSPTLYGANQPC